jgi:MbtH protein
MNTVSEVTKIHLREDTMIQDMNADDARQYTVVVNHEEQYSIWWCDRDVPQGWRIVGKTGTKTECLAYINEIWTDMRPLSLRKKMSAAGAPRIID